MEASIATFYARHAIHPQAALEQIAAAGFTHVHWCHHWTGPVLYLDSEIDQIAQWLRLTGLKFADLHASDGAGENAFRYYLSDEPWQRESGVALIKNRLEMTARLGGDAIVLHSLALPADEPDRAALIWDWFRSAMDQLIPVVRRTGVRIALENLLDNNFATTVDRALADYDAADVGLCYDAGHGAIVPGGLELLAKHKDRLLVTHLHDNNAVDDKHWVPFAIGSEGEEARKVPFAEVMRIIASSPYAKPLTLELSMHNTHHETAESFLADAHAAATKLTAMLEPDGDAPA